MFQLVKENNLFQTKRLFRRFPSRIDYQKVFSIYFVSGFWKSRNLCVSGILPKCNHFQVTAVFDRPFGERKCKIHDHVKPCLGKIWSDWVTVRIMLLRSTSARQAEQECAMKGADEPERDLVVIFSRTGDLPFDKIMKACRYTVDACGVHGVLVNDTNGIAYCKCSHV